MSLFDRFRKDKQDNDNPEMEITITRPRKAPNSIQLQIIMELEHMLEEAKKVQSPFPQETKLPMPKQVADLIEAGFENVKEVREFKEKRKSLRDKYYREMEAWNAEFNVRTECLNALRCLVQARKVYGNDTLLLPFDQFRELCERWNLTAGSFDCYAGDIPDDKLQEIIRLKKTPSQGVPIISLRYVKEFTSDIGFDRDGLYSRDVCAVRDKLLEFPFVRETHVRQWEFVTSTRGKSRTTYVTFFDGTKDDSCFYDVICGEPSKFFITAPKKMMGEGMKVTVNPRHKEDPFICAAVEYGVLIFTRWGEEASDEVIRRFEAFSKNLDKLGL